MGFHPHPERTLINEVLAEQWGKEFQTCVSFKEAPCVWLHETETYWKFHD